MSKNAKIGLLVALAAVALIAFVVLRPSSDGGGNTTTQAASTTSTTTPKAKPAKPKPKIPTVVIRGGKPVGGVQKIEVSKGDRIRFRVTDQADGDVHLHGYDVEKPVSPGNPASFNVPATITGRFEVELHPATQVAEVTVNP